MFLQYPDYLPYSETRQEEGCALSHWLFQCDDTEIHEQPWGPLEFGARAMWSRGVLGN